MMASTKEILRYSTGFSAPLRVLHSVSLPTLVAASKFRVAAYFHERTDTIKPVVARGNRAFSLGFNVVQIARNGLSVNHSNRYLVKTDIVLLLQIIEELLYCLSVGSNGFGTAFFSSSEDSCQNTQE